MSESDTERCAAAWHTRAEELADWALARVFVRTDRFGGYYRQNGKTQKSARPNKGCRDEFSHVVLVRHFKANRTEDVIGPYLLSPGQSIGRVSVTDLDAHTAKDDPDRNERYARHLYAKLVVLGFRPLLVSWGGGSYHLWQILDRDTPGAVLFSLGRWLVMDAANFGYPKAPETFPKQARVPEGKYGNWCRLVGRHHTRDVWASVFDGSAWLKGAAAVAHILCTTGDTGDTADLIPNDARPAQKHTAKTPPTSKAGGTTSCVTYGQSFNNPTRSDVFVEFNRRTSLDAVVGWHEAHGHRATGLSAGRVDFTRAGKDGTGQSFNVKDINGIPITFNFWW